MCFPAEPLAALMQAPAEAKPLTAAYIRICGAGIFFIVAYKVIAAIYRCITERSIWRQSAVKTAFTNEKESRSLSGLPFFRGVMPLP